MKFGMSTMAVAALGNTISDLLGIGSAWYVESLADKLGELFPLNILTTFWSDALPGARPPELSPEQLQMRSSRISANIGKMLGIFVGCLLGNLQTDSTFIITFFFRNVSTSFY